VYQRRWRSHLNALRPDTGIPEGLRISIGGNFVVVDEFGGTIMIDYETGRLRNGESFIIFVDGEEKVRESAGS